MTELTAPTPGQGRPRLLERFRHVRDFTTRLTQNLQAEDFVVQSMPDASPTKWHLAHTTWFFETFVLKVWMQRYRPEVPQYAYLFNSYYNAAGDMHRRDLRGMISRPTVPELCRYRYVGNVSAPQRRPARTRGTSSRPLTSSCRAHR